MTKREQNRLIRNRIEAGASAQQVYDELHGNSLVPDERLAERIREVPALARRRKYKAGHVALMVLLGLAAVLGLILGSAQNMRGVDWFILALFMVGCIACVVGLALHRGKAYYWTSGVCYLLVFGSINANWAGPEWVVVPLWITMVAVFFLCLYLRTHVLTRYIVIKEPYKNEAGEARLKSVVRFED